MLRMTVLRLVHRAHEEIQTDLDSTTSWTEITARFNKKFKTNLSVQILKKHFDFYREAEEVERTVRGRIERRGCGNP